MKKLTIIIPLIVLAVWAGVALADGVTYIKNGQIVAAEVFRPNGSTDTGSLRTGNKAVLVWDSGQWSGAGIKQSPILDTSGLSYLYVTFVNGDNATRTVNINVMLSTGTSWVRMGQAAILSTNAANAGDISIGPGCSKTFVIPPSIQIYTDTYTSNNANSRIIVWGR